MADKQIKVLGIAGSLRKGSYNRILLAAAARDHAPDGMTIESFDISDIPLYNEDVRETGFPPSVAALREAIAASDGVLLVTPEYNYSIPGVLKNAIDWASRPPDQPFAGKPMAIMGASPGKMGTARAQYHLRQVFVGLNAMMMNKPEVMVGGVSDILDNEGQVTDKATADFVTAHLKAFKAWIDRFA